MYCFTSAYPNFDSWFSVSLGILGTFEVICLLSLLESPLVTCHSLLWEYGVLKVPVVS